MRKPVFTPSEARRRETMEEARAAGRMGTARLPNTILMADGIDPTDSMILERLDAHALGLAEREPSC